MTPPLSPNDRDDAARAWAIRLKDPAFADWDGFTAWLEQDPANAVAYDRACDIDEGVVALLATPPPILAPAAPLAGAAQHSIRRISRRWFVGGGAIAAAMALIFVSTGQDPAGSLHRIETGAGERRDLALTGHTRIVLNGESAVTLDAKRPRYARLERGEALFVVQHDAKAPFVVDVGDARLIDLGTIFNVVIDAAGTRVAVAEGVVVYNPDRDAVRLDAGQALTARDGKVTLGSIVPDTVGGWQRGTLAFDAAPLDQVVADLSRSLGTPVRIDPALAARRFTGTLAVEGEPAVLLPRIAPLMGAVARGDDRGWVFAAPRRARP